MGFLALIEFLMLPPKMYNFNQRTHRLHIDGDLGDVGQILCLECMVKPDPDVFPDLYNDMWLKRYSTALVKYQWAENLSKFEGIALPGGVTLNASEMKAQAQEEITKLEEESRLNYELPVMDLMG